MRPCKTVQNIILPDLYAIVPFKASQNAAFDSVHRESMAWVESHNAFIGPKWEQFVQSCPGLLASYVYPSADSEGLRACCDYIALLFVIDETTDEQQVIEAHQAIDSHIKALANEPCDDNAIYRMTKEFMTRFNKHCSADLQQRFLKHSREYTDAVLREAELRQAGKVLSMSEFIQHRRSNSAVELCFDHIQVALGICLPEIVYKDPGFNEAYESAVDMVCWSNDIYSFAMEQARGLLGSNYINVLMKDDGMSYQEAFDYAGTVFKQRLASFLTAKASLRSFGGDIDADVAKYISGLEQWIIGNMDWSFECGRYFGTPDASAVIKRTRIITIDVE